jgi:hypothetical protein
MATNRGFSDFGDLEDQQAKEIMKGADLKTAATFNKGGRKPKEVKANMTIRVYVSPEQKELLEEYCRGKGLSESTLVRQLLIKEGIFKP